MESTCPICNAALYHVEYYEDYYGMVEQHEVCKDGCGDYEYHYAYGYTSFQIKHHSFHTSYSDDRSSRIYQLANRWVEIINNLR